MADDLSHVHTSFAGYPALKTPAIDRVAREGVYFRNAFAPTPGCSRKVLHAMPPGAEVVDHAPAHLEGLLP
jgi:arylsulfatase A-like enzyme